VDNAMFHCLMLMDRDYIFTLGAGARTRQVLPTMIRSEETEWKCGQLQYLCSC